MTEQETISWYVLQTIPVHRLEFQVLHALHQLEYQAMLPFETRCIPLPRNRGWDQVKYPLFPRYVMVALPDYREFPYIQAKINKDAEIKGKSPPVMGLLGPAGMPGKLKAKEVEFIRGLSTEGAIETGIQVGSQIEIVKGPWSGRSSRVDSLTRKGVKALIDVLGSWRLVEIAMTDIRAA